MENDSMSSAIFEDLQTSADQSQLIDYTKSVLVLPYIHRNMKLYAVVCREMYNYEGFDPTGNYLVTMLHPDKGTITFSMYREYLEEENYDWTLTEVMPALHNSFVVGIGKAIDTWEKTTI